MDTNMLHTNKMHTYNKKRQKIMQILFSGSRLVWLYNICLCLLIYAQQTEVLSVRFCICFFIHKIKEDKTCIIIYWSCTNHLLVMYRSFTGHVLVMYWSYTGHVPVMYCSCTAGQTISTTITLVILSTTISTTITLVILSICTQKNFDTNFRIYFN